MKPITHTYDHLALSDPEARRLEAIGRYDFSAPAEAGTLDRITRIAQLTLDAPMAAISVVERDRQWFMSRQGIALYETPRCDSFCSHVVALDQAVLVRDAMADERFQGNPLVTGNPHIRFYVGVPLHTPEGEVLGALCALDNKPRVATDQQLAILSELARLIEDHLELYRRAAVDSLTGVLRRSAFIAEASRDFVATARGDRPLACILLDVDHFKAVNDDHGHLTGDRVLTLMGDVLRSAVRSTDYVGRVGGEEFAVVLPGATLDDALIVAERVRSTLKERIGHSKAVPAVTVSLGVAEFTAQDPTLTHLLARADSALYRAKQSGRDRVVLDIPPPRSAEPHRDDMSRRSATGAANITSTGGRWSSDSPEIGGQVRSD